MIETPRRPWIYTQTSEDGLTKTFRVGPKQIHRPVDEDQHPDWEGLNRHVHRLTGLPTNSSAAHFMNALGDLFGVEKVQIGYPNVTTVTVGEVADWDVALDAVLRQLAWDLGEYELEGVDVDIPVSVKLAREQELVSA